MWSANVGAILLWPQWFNGQTCNIQHTCICQMFQFIFLFSTVETSDDTVPFSGPAQGTFHDWFFNHRADSRFAPSQWETALLCNHISHWLGASLESALHRNSKSITISFALIQFLMNWLLSIFAQLCCDGVCKNILQYQRLKWRTIW